MYLKIHADLLKQERWIIDGYDNVASASGAVRDSRYARLLRPTPNKLPTAVVTVREGTRALDAALDEMATVFAIPRWKAFRHVILPQLAPYIAAAADPVFL